MASNVQARGDAAEQMTKLIGPWSQACLDRDWDALLSMCNDDIVFMPPGGPAVSGDEVRPWLDSFPEIRAMSWKITDIGQDGDLGWLRGPVMQTLVLEGSEVEFLGKYVDVIRRGADGRWRFSVVIWNADEA